MVHFTLIPFKQSEEHWPRVFKDRMLNKMFDVKREDVKESWRKLHSEKIHACRYHQISRRASSQGE
jgi:hypothetical protein